MRTPRRTAASLGIALITLVAAGLATGTEAATSSQANTHHGDGHHQVLRYRVQFSPQNVIDVPPLQTHAGDYQAGDYTVFSDVLTNRSGRRIGTEGGTGMITRVDATGAQIYYSIAIHVPGGQITAGGLGSPDPHKHLAVTGGTGTFTGARGSIRVVENRDDTGTLQITLR